MDHVIIPVAPIVHKFGVCASARANKYIILIFDYTHYLGLI